MTPLGLIQPVESGEVDSEIGMPVVPQRLGGQRLPREPDRLLYLTESGELHSERELSTAIARCELQRTAILRFRPAPVEIGHVKQLTPGNVCSGELGEKDESKDPSREDAKGTESVAKKSEEK